MYREHTTPSMFDSPVKIKHTSCPQKAQEEVLLVNIVQDQEPRKFSFDGGGSVVSCGHNFTTPSESTSDSLIVDPSDIIDDAIWNIGTAAHDVTVPRRSSIISSKSDLWKWSFEENDDHELLRKEREDYPLSHNDTILFDQQMPDVEQNQIMPLLDETVVVVHPYKNREATRSCLPPSRPSRRHAGLKRNQQPPTAAPAATRATLTSDVPCNSDVFPFLSRSRSLLRSMKRT